MKSFSKLLGILLIATIGTGACSSKSGDSASTSDKVSFLLEFDNTYQTFIPCAVSGGKIDCSGNRQVIPNLSFFRPYWNTNATFIDKLASAPLGCQAGTLTDNSRINVDKIETPSGCRFSFRLYRETDALQPWKEFSQPVRTDPSTPISGSLSFMTKYNFQVVNIDNGGDCEQSVLHRVSSSASATSVTDKVYLGAGQLPFTGLFSIAPSLETLNITSISKNQNFDFKFQPALDTAPLIAAGITDDTIREYLTPFLGDFVVLYIEDSYGHKAFCKAQDAVTGAITVPANILSLFNGTTGMRAIRYKVNQTNLGSAEFKVLMKVGMYRDGTDAWGSEGGVVSLWVQ